MAVIQPFKALRYNPDRISFISRVITPPYDVIDPETEQKLLNKDRHNFIRIGMGKTPPGGRDEEEYLFIEDIFHNWRSDGILIRDNTPSIYVLEQSFSIQGTVHVRRGLIAALLLEEPGSGSVHPHENTMKGPKKDRIRLMEACRAGLSQPMLMHSDPDGGINRMVKGVCESPDFLYSFRDDNGIGHTVWRVDDPQLTESMKELMAQQPAVIADGHHRYESALSYARTHRPENAPAGSVPEDYMSVFLVSVRDSGLQSLPTHRGVRTGAGFDPQKFRNDLEKHFRITELEVENSDLVDRYYNKARGKKPLLGCVRPGGRILMLEPKNIASMPVRTDLDRKELAQLPVALLHGCIFPEMLGIEPGTESESNDVEYCSSSEQIYWGVQSGQFGTGFLLPPIAPSLIQQLAQKGRRVPIKSTYFYPKLPSGLIIYPHQT